MNTYYAGAGGGCFGPNSEVFLSDGRCVKVTEVKAGDEVCTADGMARVRCVVMLARDQSIRQLKGLGNLSITPGHPVRVDGLWKLARDLPGETIPSSGFVYNLVLDRCHVLLVNGFECITWAHGLPEVPHPYFGTDRVLEDLARMQGWGRGLVHIQGCLRSGGGGGGGVVGLIEEGASCEPRPPDTAPHILVMVA